MPWLEEVILLWMEFTLGVQFKDYEAQYGWSQKGIENGNMLQIEDGDRFAADGAKFRNPDW
eukprot:CAMPEP_0194038386 /NCGR_PEP_ID=MMETSP0009_2-20130614/10626_1 /TAXON_ID=210454 /ORGANISM="Grammatophora oceanica, Strain CCMP 410" /LENGTH=60 /DNA_ID=CAMNT_0038680867 /DNA_START=297 /DNA_END=476 /DNA_ORIENTATION=-